MRDGAITMGETLKHRNEQSGSRCAKMIDGTEKPKIPSKFAKRVARYNEFGYNNRYHELIDFVE